MSADDSQRVVITGMAINTPLGDTLDDFLAALLAGRSAITRWHGLDVSQILVKIGGDLSGYDISGKATALGARSGEPMAKRLRQLIKRAPWGTKLSALLALDAFLDAGFAEIADPERFGAVVGGHNLNSQYSVTVGRQFLEEPDFMEPLFGMNALDTAHAATVSELLGLHGPIYTVGAACASGSLALRSAVDEIRHHGLDAVMVVGAVVDISPLELQSMALMNAVSFASFNETPEHASRPFDVRREGFVAAHGGGALVVESLASARRRGARIYAEVLCAAASCDANHQTQPSETGQVRLITAALREARVAPEQIDYISAHATSTALGDLTEIRAIKRVFGTHAYALKLNATKSMLGHTCWAAPTVETVASVLQMRAGQLHPSINIDEIDPEVDIDVCAGRAVPCQVRYILKNSFGFGGINSVSILKHFEA